MERRWPHEPERVAARAYISSRINPACRRCGGSGYVQSGPQPRKTPCACQGEWEMRTVRVGPDEWEDVLTEIAPPEVAT